MTTTPKDPVDALRLADELQRNVSQTEHDDQVVLVPRWTVEGAIEELRCQHSRIEADEALMRTAADVLKQVESDFDGCYADHELKPVRAAITALRSRLETK